MTIIKILLLAIAVISSSFFVFVLLKSNEYDEMISPLDDKEFPLKDIYAVGFKILDMLHMDFKSKNSGKLRDKINIIYGEKYTEFYLRVIYAQAISFTVLTFVISTIFSCLAAGVDGLVILVVGIILSGTVYYYFITKSDSQIKKKSKMYLSEFPNAISTIALLVNSGMVLREAWNEVAHSSDKALYIQMRKVSEDMNNGISEKDALYAFSLRCATPEIKKFTSFIIQGLEKGNKDLAIALKSQSNELWEIKRQHVLQQGHLASSKLLIPIFIMFIGILIMVMGPIMTNLGV